MQENVWVWVQSTRGMQGNARETYVSGCKAPGECRECRGMPGEHMGVDTKCQGKVGESREIPG